MELHLDTANVAEAERLACIFPVTGVTISPSIIATSKEPVRKMLPRLQKAISDKDILFARAVSRNTQGMVREVKHLRDAIPGTVVKTLATSGGLAAIEILKREGITMLGTAAYSTARGLLMALAGAKYAAPYVSYVDVQGGGGIRTVQESQALLKIHAPESMMLAAGFKIPRQVLSCLLTGCGPVTLPLDIAQQMLNTPTVESAIEKLEHDRNATLGTTHLQRNNYGPHYSITR